MRYYSQTPALWAVLCLTAFCAYAYDDDRPCCRPIPHWYGALSGSVVFLNGESIKADRNVFQSQGFSPGFGISGAVGYRFNSKWRSELEAAFRQNEINTVGGQRAPSGMTYNNQKSYAFMLNAYRDFSNSSSLTPYLGAGIGMAHVLNWQPYPGPDAGEVTPLRAWTMAYQFMAGVGYTIPDTPVAATIGYRFFSGLDASVRVPGGPKVTIPNAANNIELGLRMYFK